MATTEQTQPLPAATGTLFRTRRIEFSVVGGVVLLALVLRVVHVLAMQDNPTHHHPVMDSDYHVTWARALVAGEEFQPGPFFRAPLYIWFLAGTMSVFGPESLLAPRLLQCLFGAATTLLVYLLGKRAFDQRVGLVASLLTAVQWVLIYFDGELLIPTLIVPLDLLAIWLTLGLAERTTRWRAAGAGVVWGLSAIARPNVLLFMPLVALWLLWQRRPQWRAGLTAVVPFGLGCMLPILPITAHNWFDGDDFVLIASQAGVNFWIGNNPESDGATAIVPGTRAGWWQGYQDAIAQAEAAEGRPLKASEVSRYYGDRAWDFILGQPSLSIPHFLRKLELFCKDWELGNNQHIAFFARHFSPVTWFPLSFGVIAPFGLLGLILCLRRGRLFPLWGFVPVYAAGVIAFFVCSRFRLPIVPPLLVLGAFAGTWLWTQARARRHGAVAAATAFLAVGIAYSMTTPANVRTNDSSGYMQLGVVESEELGNHELAARHLERAVEIDPGNAFARVALARVYRRLERTADAIRQLAAALELQPGDVDTAELLVKYLSGAGRLAEAEEAAQRALAIHPDNPSVLYQFGHVRLMQEQPEAALRLFDTALRHSPRMFDAAYSIGVVQRQLGRLADSASALERAVELVGYATPPFDDHVYEQLVGVLIDQRQLDRACQYARQYAERKPASPRARAMVQQVCR